MATGDKAEQKQRTVDSETARQEVERFLDLKRIPLKKRNELFKEGIKELTYAIEDGNMIFDFEKRTVTYFLLHPLMKKEGGTIDKLVMRMVIGVSQAIANSKEVDATDGNENSLAMVASLAGIAPATLRLAKNSLEETGLDTTDYTLLRYYALFFLA